ncbi:probable rRNA maturation factor [Pelagirhabdus alkalitolerans]|uniref:Endoribonuclease YbeY n=1 Tax=Pelagirhabdus alkalitolerans TaxID=1612202 RepID=A0A1G6HVN3_9BACI|nr:rRNA maturation RNase YbeY [Pelagirhabdus alkalitolerans]SDB98379.1 probable rRNA maturation factor [Pelagirhabdus alkalitolerans]
MQIDYHDDTNTVKDDYIDLIDQLIRFAAKKEAIQSEMEMSINFVDNEMIQELNRNYRQLDKPTDVLSFPLLEEGKGEVAVFNEELPISLGDIVISVEKAKEQAAEYDHSLEREFSFLALHGFLHLLGYDHMNEEDEKAMFKKQEDILHEFGLSRD